MLRDWRTAPVDDRLRAAFGLVETLTLRPDEVGPDDLASLRGHGLGDEAIEDVVTVTAAFNTIDRIADALGFESQPPAGLAASVKQLLTRGYK